MSKKFKITGVIAITLVLGYFIYFYFRAIKPSHSFNKQRYRQYLWILTDSARQEIEPMYCYSLVQKQDIYNGFHFNGDYILIVWEFKSLRNAPLAKVTINQNIYLDDLKFGAGEVLNSRSNYLPITVRSDDSFKNLMEIDVGTDSKIEKQIKGPNYKGFYGKIKRMALRNENGGDQIPSLGVVYNYTQIF